MRSIDRIYHQLTAAQQIKSMERNPSFRELDSGEKASFQDVLQDALHQVDELQQRADEIVLDFSEGKVEDVHDVMVALEKADVGLKMAVEVRNRLIEGYREIINLRF